MQVSRQWTDLLMDLEERHGLDIDNLNHIWLMQILFLPMLNNDLNVFQSAWNNHVVRWSGKEHRSPADLFVMGMFECGVRGYQLPAQEMDATVDHGMPESLQHAGGHPQHLNYVEVNPPSLTEERLRLLPALAPLLEDRNRHDVIALWTEAIVICCTMYPNIF